MTTHPLLGRTYDNSVGADAAPTPLPAADAMTTSGFSTALDRVLSLVCLASLLPLVLVARTLPADISRVWLIVFGGAFAASSALIPVYAWSRRGIKPLAALYAAAVGLAALTWPIVGTGGDVPAPLMVVSFLLGLGAVCLSVVLSTRAALWYAAIGGAWMVVVRLLPAGGSAPLASALLDGALLIAQSVALLLIVQYVRDAAATLDSQQQTRYVETAEAAVNEALFAERRRLDAIIHDEVMTTFVAAAGDATGSGERIANLARAALATLGTEAVPDDRGEVSTDQLARLVKDVASNVCPRAAVLAELPAPPVAVPAGVARTLLQATREASLNAEKHSDAANVQVLLTVEARGRRVSVRISVTDDGKGFDPASVPDGRLGLKVSLAGRLDTIGGRTEIVSRPGRGTSVRLSWSGENVHESAVHRVRMVMKDHPLFTRRPPVTVAYAAVAVLLLHLVEAAYLAPGLPSPLLLVPAAALAVGGLAAAAYGLAPHSAGRWWPWATAACLLGTASLAVAAAGATGPRYADWFVLLVAAGVVALYAGGHATLAAALAVGHAAVVLVWGGGPASTGALLAALEPAFWLGVEALMFLWLRGLWWRLNEVERSVTEGARVNAAMFSRTVLQEVWLGEIRAEVGPALSSIADTSTPTTPADRKEFLLMEGTLRDQIKAANLTSPRLSAAIRAARGRGVEVNLVDNRGERLPDVARRTALRIINDIVQDATGGRVVARTAPPGYSDVVTIVHVTPAGESLLTRVGADGSVTSGA